MARLCRPLHQHLIEVGLAVRHANELRGGATASFDARLLERGHPTMALLLFDGTGDLLGTRQADIDRLRFTAPGRGVDGSQRRTVWRKSVQRVQQRPASRTAVQGTRPHNLLIGPRSVDFGRILGENHHGLACHPLPCRVAVWLQHGLKTRLLVLTEAIRGSHLGPATARRRDARGRPRRQLRQHSARRSFNRLSFSLAVFTSSSTHGASMLGPP